MADTFGADPAEARRVSGELAGIRQGLDGTANLFAGAEACASARVQAALGDFAEDSAETRRTMAQLLDRASGLLRGLAEGAGELDRSLAGAFDEQAGAR